MGDSTSLISISIKGGWGILVIKKEAEEIGVVDVMKGRRVVDEDSIVEIGLIKCWVWLEMLDR